MKKQMNPALPAEKKLRLNKKTISNLATPGVNSNNFCAMGPTKGNHCIWSHGCHTSF